MAGILIVGCGYVGQVLARELLAADHNVWGLRRGEARGIEGLHSLRGDVADPESLRSLPRAEVMVYLVSPEARTPEAYRGCYVEGLRNVLRAAPTERVVLITSTAVFGQNHGEWVDEESETAPADYRGAAMLEGEALVRSKPGGAVVRFSGIYGPGRDRLIRAVQGGSARCSEPPRYTNRIHRDDCAGLLAHLAQRPPRHDLYIGSDDHPTADCEVLDWLAARLDVPAPRRAANTSGANKRIRNARLAACGYHLRFPGFREGYGAMLESP